MCPYYDAGSNLCNFFSSVQESGHRDSSCLSNDNWKHCVNYTNRNDSEKMSKRLR